MLSPGGARSRKLAPHRLSCGSIPNPPASHPVRRAAHAPASVTIRRSPRSDGAVFGDDARAAARPDD
eukprot:3389534-Prymnesium_polylepis.1